MVFQIASGVFVLSFATGALARCMMPWPMTLRTQDGSLAVTLRLRGSLEIRRTAKQLERVKIDLHGHHYHGTLTPSGDRLIVWDPYEGIGIYRPDGKTVRYYDGNQFLTPQQVTNRSGKWACHPEGKWLDSVNLTSDQIRIRLYNGTLVRLRISDGSVIGNQLSPDSKG